MSYAATDENHSTEVWIAPRGRRQVAPPATDQGAWYVDSRPSWVAAERIGSPCVAGHGGVEGRLAAAPELHPRGRDGGPQLEAARPPGDAGLGQQAHVVVLVLGAHEDGARRPAGQLLESEGPPAPLATEGEEGGDAERRGGPTDGATRCRPPSTRRDAAGSGRTPRRRRGRPRRPRCRCSRGPSRSRGGRGRRWRSGPSGRGTRRHARPPWRARCRRASGRSRAPRPPPRGLRLWRARPRSTRSRTAAGRRGRGPRGCSRRPRGPRRRRRGCPR